jgi:hypothetical protein
MSKKKAKPPEVSAAKIKREPLHLVEPGEAPSYEWLNQIFSQTWDIYDKYEVIWDESLVEWMPGISVQMIEPHVFTTAVLPDPQILAGDFGTIKEVKLKYRVIMVAWDKGKTDGLLVGLDRFKLWEPGTCF